MVFNQPTRGLDMGAVDRIHKVILSEKDQKQMSFQEFQSKLERGTL